MIDLKELCNQNVVHSSTLHNMYAVIMNCGTSFSMSDVNECMTDKDNCHSDAVCINEVGSFRCECFEGFVGDGVNDCKSKHYHL